MSTYVIGDVQGCYDELLTLLGKINFDERQDRLWFAGDLVNRGPKSLDVLRFVKDLGESAISVLGNHDLHLLAVALAKEKKKSSDTLDAILKASERDELLDWLRQLPLAHQDKGFLLVHAGLPPQWDNDMTLSLASEVQTVLGGDDCPGFLADLYGNHPRQWSNELEGMERLRFIVNALTRLRYCDSEGNLYLEEKGPPGSQNRTVSPWFTLPHRRSKDTRILFGHWSTVYLGEIKDFSAFNVYPLDTGCIWGGKLTAFRLEDERWFGVASRQNA